MSKAYIPDRVDIVWLDFDPANGKENGTYRPALILSYKAYNKATGLVISAQHQPQRRKIGSPCHKPGQRLGCCLRYRANNVMAGSQS